MSVRILAVGDMHLGRRPRRLPAGLGDHGIDPRSLTPAVAWAGVVDAALEQRVQVVLLAGDVIESLEDRFEAYAHLENGVKRLVDAGIRVLGVAGNHDVIALPRLAQQIPGFQLLGEGGAWESAELDFGKDRVRIVGWSFPNRHHSENPLDGFPVLPDDGTCTLGLLHCDLDAHESEYAPVRSSELERTICDAWLLGHIHAPSQLSSPRPIGYLGSVAGLDPGEPGARGPWLLEAHGKGRVEVVAQLSPSPLRFEREVVDCSGWDEGSANELEGRLEAAVHAALEQVHARFRVDLGGARVVAVRISLCGRTRYHSELLELRRKMPFGELIRSLEGVLYFPEKLVDELTPAIDLAELALVADPPGLLARRLIALEQGGTRTDELVAGFAREIEDVEDKSAHWSGALELRSPVRERALRVGLRALEGLLAQRTEEGAS